jgi:predicted DNA-binding protein
MESEVVSVRLPTGMIQRLKLLACRRSLELKREVRWTTLVREAIEKVLATAGDQGSALGHPEVAPKRLDRQGGTEC